MAATSTGRRSPDRADFLSAEIRLLRWPDRQRDDYERLAGALARVREAAARARGELTVMVPTPPEEPNDVDRARALLAQRRARDEAAGPHADLFADPVWDMLLALFVAHGEGRAVRSDTLTDPSSVKPAAARRWLLLLVERGFVVDGTHVVLTATGECFVRRCISGS